MKESKTDIGNYNRNIEPAKNKQKELGVSYMN